MKPRLALLLVPCLILTACGGDAGTADDSTPPASTGATPASDGGDAGAIMVAPTDSSGTPAPSGAVTVAQAREDTSGQPILVRAYAFNVNGVVRLCDGIAESMPPQCGEPSMIVDGDPQLAPTDNDRDGVKWSSEPIELLAVVSNGKLIPAAAI